MRMFRALIWTLVIIDLVFISALYLKLSTYSLEQLNKRELVGFNLYVDFLLLTGWIVGSIYLFEKRDFYSHYGTKLASLGDCLVPLFMLLSIFYLVIQVYPNEL